MFTQAEDHDGKAAQGTASLRYSPPPPQQILKQQLPHRRHLAKIASKAFKVKKVGRYTPDTLKIEHRRSWSD